MKRFFIITTLLVLNATTILAQSEYCIARIDNNGDIIIGDNMTDAFGAEDLTKSRSFTTISNSEITVNKIKYTINTGCLNNWDTYNEDMFNVISISKENNKLLEIRRPDCWTFTYGGKSETNLNKYTNNRYYIPIEISDNFSILIFVGWPYGGEMPLLTIVALTDNDVKLVFNKNMAIDSITKTMTSVDIKIQSSIVEYNANNNAVNQPYTHHIYCTKDGLFFK